MKFVTGIKIRIRRHDNQHNNTPHSQTQGNDIQLKVKYGILNCYTEFVKLCVIMLRDILLRVSISKKDFMLSTVILSVIMLIIIILMVIMLSVHKSECHYADCHYTDGNNAYRS
jgi:hypothetical protein